MICLTSRPGGADVTGKSSIFERLIVRRFFLRKNKLRNAYEYMRKHLHKNRYSEDVIVLNGAAAHDTDRPYFGIFAGLDMHQNPCEQNGVLFSRPFYQSNPLLAQTHSKAPHGLVSHEDHWRPSYFAHNATINLPDSHDSTINCTQSHANTGSVRRWRLSDEAS